MSQSIAARARALFSHSLLLVAIVSLPAGAQTAPTGDVIGRVVDTAGAPIQAARVRIPELHREDGTHTNGNFQLTGLHPGLYTLIVQRIGYTPHSEPLTVLAGQRSEVTITLRPRVISLGPVIVTGTIGERSRDQVVGATSSLSGEALDRELGATVASSLARQPGMSSASIGPATARPVIRGLSGDRILVIEDGQRPGDMSSTSGDHAIAVDPLTAQRMEVVRGPMSLLYGSSALGGVVNIVREEIPLSMPEHVRGMGSMQGESAFGGATAGGEIVAPVGRWLAVRGEGSARRLGNTRTPAGTLSNTDARTLGAAFGAAYITRHGHTGASYRFYDSEYGIPGGFVGSHPEGVDVAMRRHGLRGESEFHLDEGFVRTIKGTAVFTDYNHREIEKGGRVGTRFGQQMLAGEVQARHEAAGPFSLGAGGIRVQLRGISTGGSLRTPATDDQSYAAYLVEEVSRGRFQFQGGARYDLAHYAPASGRFIDVGDRRIEARPRTFGSISASLGTLVTLREGVRVGGSASRAYRTPDFNELYSNGPHLAANSFEVGDPELDSETGLGLDVFARLTSARVRLEVAAYHNRIDDYISSSSRGRAIESLQGAPLFQYTNEDAQFSGAEGEIEVEVRKGLFVHAVASHVVARFTNDRAPIPVFTLTETGVDTTFTPASTYPSFVPPLHGRIELRYERPRFYANLASRLAAPQERLGDFETSTAGYAVADAGVGYRFLVRSQLHAISLKADNLLDTEYREHLSRTRAIQPEPGINIGLLYRVTF